MTQPLIARGRCSLLCTRLGAHGKAGHVRHNLLGSRRVCVPCVATHVRAPPPPSRVPTACNSEGKGSGGEGGGDASTGAVVSSLRESLADHEKPSRQRYHNAGKPVPAPARCEASVWTLPDRKAGVQALAALAKDNLAERDKVCACARMCV